jgi:hypothetical protein
MDPIVVTRYRKEFAKLLVALYGKNLPVRLRRHLQTSKRPVRAAKLKVGV